MRFIHLFAHFALFFALGLCSLNAASPELAAGDHSTASSHSELKSNWAALNVGGLTWSDDLGLWGRSERDGTKVHESRFAAGSLLLAARYGLLADERVEKVLRGILSMQDPSRGGIKMRYEDSGIKDSNIAFFVARILILLRHQYQAEMSSGALDALDTILQNTYTFFYREAQEDSAFYPNKYLGDLVTARLIQQIYNKPADEVALLEGRMLEAATYWQEEAWGWGEHMSDTYAGVCIDLISLYLLLSPDHESEVYKTYLGLTEELLRLDAQFGNGPRVPALRSYSFSARGGREVYRDRIEPWDASVGRIANPYWRESALIQSELYDLQWSDLFRDELLEDQTVSGELKVPSFGGTEALAYLAEDVRLGGMSQFPIMPEAEHILWGLAWQSFPVALWKSQGDWAFLQWETEEAGELKAHPANSRSGARSLTDQINPPIVGRTYSLQQGGNLLVLRIMPALSASWSRVTDRFTMINLSADSVTEAAGQGFDQLVLGYPERVISVSSFSLVNGIHPELEEFENTKTWGYTFPVEVSPRDQREHLIVNVWGISLDGAIVDAPILEEIDHYGKVPLSDAEQPRILHWKWPGAEWDVVIDPSADQPLRFK